MPRHLRLVGIEFLTELGHRARPRGEQAEDPPPGGIPERPPLLRLVAQRVRNPHQGQFIRVVLEVDNRLPADRGREKISTPPVPGRTPPLGLPNPPKPWALSLADEGSICERGIQRRRHRQASLGWLPEERRQIGHGGHKEAMEGDIRLAAPRYARLSPAQRRDAVSLLAALISGTSITSRDGRRAPRSAARSRAPQKRKEIAALLPTAAPKNGKGAARKGPGGAGSRGSGRGPDGLRGVFASLTFDSARPGEARR
jgi:hypothetical protein